MSTARSRLFAPAATAVAAAAMAMAGGCASMQGGPDHAAGDASSAAVIDADYAAAISEYTVAGVSESRRAAVREGYVTRRAARIDRAYSSFRQDLYAQRTQSAIGLDVATMTLTAIAAAVGDSGVKTGAAALAGGLVGGKASIDKNLYFDRTLPALLTQMDSGRLDVRARLLAGLLLPTSGYSLMQADADLSDYQAAGTVAGAITAMTDQAGKVRAQADKTLRDRLPSEAQIIGLNSEFTLMALSDSSTTRQFAACLDQNGVAKPFARQPLIDWIRRDAADISSPTELLRYQSAEGARARALQDPTIQALLKRCAAP